MAFEINELRREASGGMYVSPERLCLTADGEVVSEDDPRAVRLLVGKGCEIPAAEAAKYGLIAGAADEATEPPSSEEPSASPAEESAVAQDEATAAEPGAAEDGDQAKSGQKKSGQK